METLITIVFFPAVMYNRLLLWVWDSTPFLYHGFAALVFAVVLLKVSKSLPFELKHMHDKEDLRSAPYLVSIALSTMLSVCFAVGMSVLWPAYLLYIWCKRTLESADVILEAEQVIKNDSKA